MTNEGTLSIVGLNATNLDLTDVLAVVTSRAETRFHTELANAKKLLTEAQTEQKRLEREVKKVTKADEQHHGEKLAAVLRDAVVAAGGTVSLHVKSSYDSGRRDDEGNLTCDVFVKAPGNHNCATFTARFLPSTELQKLEADVEKTVFLVENAQNVALGWRKKLANVPLLERRARAKLAETKLRGTTEGQELLDVLTGDFENELLALPG